LLAITSKPYEALKQAKSTCNKSTNKEKDLVQAIALQLLNYLLPDNVIFI
jgi:hypothetical protein